MAEKIVMTNSDESTSAIFGSFDSNVRKIEEHFNVRVSNRNSNGVDGDAIFVSGDAKIINTQVIPEIGSDHRAYMSEIVF